MTKTFQGFHLLLCCLPILAILKELANVLKSSSLHVSCGFKVNIRYISDAHKPLVITNLKWPLINNPPWWPVLPLASIGGPRWSIIGPLGSPIMPLGSPIGGPLMSCGPRMSGGPMCIGGPWCGGAPMKPRLGWQTQTDQSHNLLTFTHLVKYPTTILCVSLSFSLVCLFVYFLQGI